jgi:hypothetical protein
MVIEADPMTWERCTAVLQFAIESGLVYAADGLPPIARLACVPIEDA